MFFWRRVAPQIPEEGLKQTATPGYMRNFRDLNDQVSRGKSFSGYERNPLFLNLHGEGFSEVAGILGVDFDDDARAVATMDWDRDGNLDLWISNRSAPQLRLLRNKHPVTNAFISVKLIGNGTTTNRDAVGARLTLRGSEGTAGSQIRSTKAGNGFLAQSSAWVHFGLGEESRAPFELTVQWPGGDAEIYQDLRAGKHYPIAQEGGVLRETTDLAEVSLPRAETAPDAEESLKQSGFWVVNQVPFPALSYTDESGTTRSTTEFKGQPVLINLWATWCAPCREELAVFVNHSDQLKSMGAAVLALNVDGLTAEEVASTKAKPQSVLKRLGYQLPHGTARKENLAKIEILIEYLTSRRSSLSVPTSILVDANGNTAAVYLEPVHWEQLSNDLSLLKVSEDLTLKRASPRAGQWFADPRQIDHASYVSNFATRFGMNGFPEESERLHQLIRGSKGSGSARDLYNQAKALADQGQMTQAIERYQGALELEPEYGRALTGLGAIYLRQKKIDEAKALFEKAIQIDPNHATAQINLATIDQAQGNASSALQRLRGVAANNPEYHEAHLSLGSLLAASKQHEEAIRHLRKAVELNPKSVVGYLNLAKVYGVTSQLTESEDCYRRVIELDSRMAYPHYGIGNLQAGRGDHRAATVSYRQAISLGAKNPATYTRLGQSLIAVGDREGAKVALESALALNSDYAAAKQAIRALVETGE